MPAGLIPPDLLPWLVVFYNAFTDLTRDRRWADGPIPWSSCETWARKYGLDTIATALLHTHIRAMDLTFLAWRAEQKPKEKPTPREALRQRRQAAAD